MHKKNKKIHILIISFFFCLTLFSVYEILVLSGCLGNKEKSPVAILVPEDKNLGSGQVALQGDNVPNAKSYNVCYSEFQGAKKE